MLGILLVSGRMPSASLDAYGPLTLTLVLTSFASLALGLMASAAVANPDQAGQLMPALILPQVLFSGAILAVPSMNAVGRFISNLMITRWSFEGLGHIVDLNNLFQNGTSPVGASLLLTFEDTFSRRTAENWAILLAFSVVFLAATCLILKRKSVRT